MSDYMIFSTYDGLKASGNLFQDKNDTMYLTLIRKDEASFKVAGDDKLDAA